MYMDDIIENVNEHIDAIESKIGTIEIRKHSIGAWILAIDGCIMKIKGVWNVHNYSNFNISSFHNTGIISKGLLNDFFELIASGICCLEQYNNIYPDSCPWEHMFDYDDPMKIEEFVLFIENSLSTIKNEFLRHSHYCVLENVKTLVIYSISCILQHTDCVYI